MWLFFPKTKAIVSVLTTVITGLLSSALITQITNNKGKLEWSKMTDKGTFYFICGLVVVSIVYNIFTTVEETNYRKSIDDHLLEKFVKDEGLSTLATEVNKAFKNGDKSKLSDLMEMKETFIKNLGKS